jgi:hypothetical protein
MSAEGTKGSTTENTEDTEYRKGKGCPDHDPTPFFLFSLCILCVLCGQ